MGFLGMTQYDRFWVNPHDLWPTVSPETIITGPYWHLQLISPEHLMPRSLQPESVLVIQASNGEQQGLQSMHQTARYRYSMLFHGIPENQRMLYDAIATPWIHEWSYWLCCSDLGYAGYTAALKACRETSFGRGAGQLESVRCVRRNFDRLINVQTKCNSMSLD